MVFGITGGSGSGKSTVSALLRKMGADIIDADKIARIVTERGSRCLDELAEAFGSEILFPDGTLNRKKLAEKAFSDRAGTSLLNKITHKYIKDETERRIASSKSDMIGIDGAVIIGSPVEELCEKIIFVTAPRSVRSERIKLRDSLTDAEAERRLGAQPADEVYISNSDYVIDNGGDSGDLTEKTERIYKTLKRSMAH